MAGKGKERAQDVSSSGSESYGEPEERNMFNQSLEAKRLISKRLRDYALLTEGPPLRFAWHSFVLTPTL